jgi:hypothetical protein
VLAKIFTKGIFVGHRQPLVEIEFQFKQSTSGSQEGIFFSPPLLDFHPHMTFSVRALSR